ncbi:hypothetical protein SAMN02745181_1177 [Rubritalea squalenifaciens DSM 18772]|uniref:Uncharacterized protein n=1 Tax=Rubritalea squalenifaciens DSM 18772 TaxID=1123071 RepID=A0A1M6GI91_9BACT|nr:hypothetical protein [Rubritalea squalenifaciens]SHJ09621.1 hypothetical protein SAMN02745181_1177 [Rubritalea squalenifaciens DSM 18772]
MRASKTDEQHALIKLRELLKLSQRNLVAGFSGPYIGSVERGRAKVSRKLSEAIRKEHGAWIQPGFDVTDVYEAFGPEWEQEQHVVKKMSEGKVLFTGDYKSGEDLRAALQREEEGLAGKKSVHAVHVMPGKLTLKRYSEDSKAEYLSHRMRHEEDPKRHRLEKQKLNVLVEMLLDMSPDYESELKMYRSLSTAIEQVIAKHDLKDKVKAAYEARIQSLLDLFPGFEGAKKVNVIAVTKLMHRQKTPMDTPPKSDSFIDALVTPQDFELFKDWSREAMDKETWLRIYDEASEAARGED